MDEKISKAIQKSGAKSLNHITSYTIRVRQTVYSAFERIQSGFQFDF